MNSDKENPSSDGELIQYILVNNEIQMSAGKVAAQVGHACTIVALKQQHNGFFKSWLGNGQKKIILQASKNMLEELENSFFSVRDAGHTELQPNTLTVVSLGVMTRQQAATITKKLQLYR